MTRIFAVVTEVHDAFVEALECHDLYALVERGRPYQQTMIVHAVLGSGRTHSIPEYTAQAITSLCTYYVLCVQWR